MKESGTTYPLSDISQDPLVNPFIFQQLLLQIQIKDAYLVQQSARANAVGSVPGDA